MCTDLFLVARSVVQGFHPTLVFRTLSSFVNHLSMPFQMVCVCSPMHISVYVWREMSHIQCSLSSDCTCVMCAQVLQCGNCIWSAYTCKGILVTKASEIPAYSLYLFNCSVQSAFILHDLCGFGTSCLNGGDDSKQASYTNIRLS